MNNFKILPLMVFVAMLAFSVRMADVISGVSNLTGSANATDAAPPPAAEHKDEPAEAKPGDLVVDDIKQKAEADAKKEADAKAAAAEEKPAEWRDPNNEDPGFIRARNEIFDDLAKRREDLDKREKDVMTREALLKAAEQELDRKYQELALLKGEIEGLLTKQSEEEKAQVESLVKIYEGMKPKDAARIFDTLDLDILVSVVGEMSERKLSPILAQMNAERARTLTIMLAEQKKLPTLPESN